MHAQSYFPISSSKAGAEDFWSVSKIFFSMTLCFDCLGKNPYFYLLLCIDSAWQHITD